MVKCENCSSLHPLSNPNEGVERKRATSGRGVAWLGDHSLFSSGTLKGIPFFSFSRIQGSTGQAKELQNQSFRRIEAMLHLTLVFFEVFTALSCTITWYKGYKGCTRDHKSDKRVHRQAKSIHPLTVDRVRSFVLFWKSPHQPRSKTSSQRHVKC